MKVLLFLLVSFCPLWAGAEEAQVFKCKSAGNETVYQSEPCAPTEKQNVLEVEAHTPEEREKAEAQLRDWQEKEALQDAEESVRTREQQSKEQELARQQAELQQRQLQEQRRMESQRSWNPFKR